MHKAKKSLDTKCVPSNKTLENYNLRPVKHKLIPQIATTVPSIYAHVHQIQYWRKKQTILRISM